MSDGTWVGLWFPAVLEPWVVKGWEAESCLDGDSNAGKEFLSEDSISFFVSFLPLFLLRLHRPYFFDQQVKIVQSVENYTCMCRPQPHLLCDYAEHHAKTDRRLPSAGVLMSPRISEGIIGPHLY